MKKKYLTFSILTMILAAFISCSSADDDKKEQESNVSVYKSQMKLRQESKITYMGADTDFYKEIVTYDPQTEEVSTIETFDYTDFDMTLKTGIFTSEVCKVSETTKVIESSQAVISGNDTDGYTKVIQYYKVNNDVTAEKPYLETQEAAEDKSFKRNTFKLVFSPADGNLVKGLSLRKYDEGKLVYEVSFHTDGKTWDNEKTPKENYENMDFNVVSFNTFNTNGTLDRTTKVVCNEDPSANPDINMVAECYNYDEDFFSTNYVVKRTYSAIIKNGYTAIFSDLENPDFSILDEVEELPSGYEGIKFTEYETSPGSSNYVYYPATITTMNDEWEIIYKKNYSYGLMPGTTAEYYPIEEVIWTKKSGEENTTIILQKLSVVKKEYYMDKSGNLCLHHQLYISDAYYGTEGSGSGTDWDNN